MFLKFILSLLKIGIIGYGGGAATLPLIKVEFVDKYKIITEEEFLEILGICNILPGPLITKYVAVLGYRLKGVIGAILAIIAIILPSSIAMIFILNYFSNSSSNENIMNMIACIVPVVSIIMIMMTVDFIGKAKEKFSTKGLFISTLFFCILLIGLKVNVVFAIIGLIVLSFVVPKREGE